MNINLLFFFLLISFSLYCANPQKNNFLPSSQAETLDPDAGKVCPGAPKKGPRPPLMPQGQIRGRRLFPESNPGQSAPSPQS